MLTVNSRRKFLATIAIAWLQAIHGQAPMKNASDGTAGAIARHVFDIVKTKFPLIASRLSINVTDSSTPQAYTDCNFQVSISEGAVRDLASTGDQFGALLFILGHEVGHNILCHIGKQTDMNAHEQEYFADFFGSIVVRSEDRDAGQRIALEAMRRWGATVHNGPAVVSKVATTHPSIKDREARLETIWSKKKPGTFGAHYALYEDAIELLSYHDLASIKSGIGMLEQINQYLEDAGGPAAGKLAAVSLLNLTLAKANLQYYATKLVNEQRFPFAPVLSFQPLFKKSEFGRKGSHKACDSESIKGLQESFDKARKYLDKHIQNFPDDNDALLTEGILGVINFCANYSSPILKAKIDKSLELIDRLLPAASGLQRTEYLNNKAILLLAKCASRSELDKCDPGILRVVKENFLDAVKQLRSLSLLDQRMLKTVAFNQANYYEKIEKNPEKKSEFVSIYRGYLEEGGTKHDGLYHILMKTGTETIPSKLREIVPPWLGMKGKEVASELNKQGYLIRYDKSKQNMFVSKNQRAFFRFGIEPNSGTIIAIEYFRDSAQRFNLVTLGKNNLADAMRLGYSGADGSLQESDVAVHWVESPKENVLIKCKFEKK